MRTDCETGQTASEPTSAAPSPDPEAAIVHLLGDDRKAARALARLLAESGREVVCHRSVRAMRRAAGHRPGCLVLQSVGRAAEEGAATLGLVERLRAELPHLPLILVSARDTACIAAEAMRRGAFYVLPEHRAPEFLAAQVAEAFRRHRGDDGEGGPDGVLAAPSRLAGLTVRESAVFREIVAGHTSKAVALRLGISARTVETHRANIMRKTGATNLADLIALARDAGNI